MHDLAAKLGSIFPTIQDRMVPPYPALFVLKDGFAKIWLTQ